MTPALESVVAQLKALRGPRADDLAGVLAAPLSFDDVRAFVRFDGDERVRTLVYGDGRVELWLASWRPGQSTPLHRHGPSARAFRVLRGAVTETVLGERDRVWAPGAVVAEGGPRVHQLTNAGPDPLLTLHAYAPPSPAAPAPPPGPCVVVVGGGFSAAAFAYHLLRLGGEGLRLHVIEAGPWLGRGIAYGVESELFRLNVPASKMSLDPGVPDDFVRFAGVEAEPHAFLGRALYGRYVTERLADAIARARARLWLWRDEAVGMSDAGVALRGGRVLHADAVVLATGLSPRVRRAPWHPGVVDAWDECALATLPRQGRILLVGAGLSALDVVAFLDAQGFEGEVTIVSRRGLLPLSHEATFHPVAPLSADVLARAPRELRSLVRWVREAIESPGEGPWQRAADRLRPHVAHLYRSLSPRDRARFVRHVRPYWDVVRHRAPSDALARVETWAKAGRVRRLAGSATVADGAGDGVSVVLAERGGARRTERFDAVVRCIGPALDMREAETPLLRSLVDGGFARLTAQGLGIETTAEGRVVDAWGQPSTRIVALGAVRRASHWEATSVPDIATQARDLARLLLEGAALS